MIRYVEKDNIKEVTKDSVDVSNGILLFKDGDIYIAKEENRLEALDFNDVIYKLYIRNRTSKTIYFVGVEEEEVKKIHDLGMLKKEFKPNIIEMQENPKYEDDERKIKTEFIIDENILDIKYTVKEEENEESFKLKMNIIYDTSIEFEKGEILTEEYMKNVKDQLSEKLGSEITLKEYTADKVKVIK